MSVYVLSPTSEQIWTVVRSFILQVLPQVTRVFQGQENRTPEPLEVDFVVMQKPVSLKRLSTNLDAYVDCAFYGSVTGAELTVTQIVDGLANPIEVGNYLFGPSVEANTQITAQTGGDPGGVGTYTLSVTQTVPQAKLASGRKSLENDQDVMVQIDVHGPNSWDNSAAIATALRDQYAAQFFADALVALGLPDSCVAPLYADEAKQVPFLNEQQQVENRFIVDAHLQVNQTISVPQQFADQLDVTLHEVDATASP